MSAVRSRGNKATELWFIAIFRAHGIIGWRWQRPLFGHPDFVFPALKLTVFVGGCFWHGCPIHGARLNKTLPSGKEICRRHANHVASFVPTFSISSSPFRANSGRPPP